MKITALKTFIVPPRRPFLKTETDEGIIGWSEPVIEGKAHTVETCVHEMADYLVGRNPMRIEDHWQALYRGGFYRGGPILMSALAGIDQALWDIEGKAHGLPVHQLLGGPVRDGIKVYSWIGGDRPADVAQNATDAVARGFTALKMNGAEAMQIVDDLVDRSVFGYKDGSVAIPQGPGLGVQIDAAAVIRAADTGHRWRNPL